MALMRARGEEYSQLAHSLLTLIQQPHALCAVQCQVHFDAPHVAKRPCACILLTKGISEGHGDFFESGCGILSSEA
jgi:hypothetical protein